MMRKLIIALAAAGSTLAIATPAAAQYFPQQQSYGYNAYGNAYGRNNWGQVRSLQVRLNNVERQISRLDRRDRIGDNSADRLRFEADRLEQRLRNVSRNGLNPYEANDINVRIARLEQRVQFAMQNRNGRYGQYGWNGNNGYNGQFVDRDRDGRDDRYEDDRGHDHDD
jgi:hypothetical protein